MRRPVLTRTRLAKTVFALGAVVSGAWAIYNLGALVEMYESGGGGFVSSAALDLLKYVIPAAIAFWLATRVRDRSGRVQVLRRAHQLVSLTIVVLVILLAAAAFAGAFSRGVDGPWRGVLFAAFIGGALWLPLQVFFVAAFSGLLIKQGAPDSAIDRSP
jgi:hypothetical protein